MRDERHGKREALFEAGQDQRQRASQAQSRHSDRPVVLREQPAEQRPRVEQCLA